ncbi:MAG: hypothetical protein J6K03_01660 [Oscillospiraceae bacterium]|nr:hypothetical protein [Oscillospiraceae bacterium]
MKTLSLCLLVAQGLILLVLCLLAWQIWSFLRRKDAPKNDQLTEEQTGFVVIRMRIFFICLAIGTILGVVQAVLRFVNLLSFP